MFAAEGGEVAFAGDAVLVERGGVVGVAALGGPGAAGVAAGAVPGVDQVPEEAAGSVGLGEPGMPAVASFEPFHVDRRLPGRAGVVGWPIRCAAVGDRLTVGASEGQAP